MFRAKGPYPIGLPALHLQRTSIATAGGDFAVYMNPLSRSKSQEIQQLIRPRFFSTATVFRLHEISCRQTAEIHDAHRLVDHQCTVRNMPGEE